MLPLHPELKRLLHRIDRASVVDTLAAIHGARARRQGRDLTSEEEDTRARTREVLRQRERRLVLEGRVMDDLLSALEPARPKVADTLRQQEIELAGERGAWTGGRFLLSNASERTASFTFRIGMRDDGTPPPPICFQPDPVTLPPGSTHRVRIRVDLRREVQPGSLTIPVDVIAARALSQRLWIAVDVS